MNKRSLAKAAAALTLALTVVSVPTAGALPMLSSNAVVDAASGASQLGVTISNKVVPTGNLAQGKPYVISGNIYSANSNILSVFGGVYTADGSTAVLYCEDTPSSKSYDLKAKFDYQLAFNKLAAGSYKYRITVRTVQDDIVVAESDFTVGNGGSSASPSTGSSSITVTDKKVPTGNLPVGQPYIIGGFLSSGSPITQVYGGVYSADGSTAVLYCQDTPNATTYNLKTKFDYQLAFNKLTAGSYLYKIVAKTAQGEAVVAESNFTVGNGGTNTTPSNGTASITVSGKKVPSGNLAQGQPYIIGGFLTSGTPITQVYGGVYTADGKNAVLYCEDKPNTVTYDLKSKFDYQLAFNKLASGSYLYKIVAKTAQGEAVIAESTFTVGNGGSNNNSGQTASGITVSNKIVPTGTLRRYQTYSIAGILSSNTNIAQVYGGIYSADGKNCIIYCSDNPGTTTYDLRNKFDYALTFNTLPAGSYTYKIVARTVTNDVVVAESSFTVA